MNTNSSIWLTLEQTGSGRRVSSVSLSRLLFQIIANRQTCFFENYDAGTRKQKKKKKKRKLSGSLWWYLCTCIITRVFWTRSLKMKGAEKHPCRHMWQPPRLAGSLSGLCVDMRAKRKKLNLELHCVDRLQRERCLRGYSMPARWAVGWRGVNVCVIQRFGAPVTMHTDLKEKKKLHSSVACLLRWQRLPAIQTPQHNRQQPRSCSPSSPLGSFYLHNITVSLFPTFYVFGHLPPPLICKRSQPLSQQMWAYWRSVLTTWGWICWKESR